MSRSPQLSQFIRREAAYQLATIVPPQRINPGYVAGAFKLAGPQDAPEPFWMMPEVRDLPRDERYFWHQRLYPTITDFLNDIEAKLWLVKSRPLKVMFSPARFKDPAQGRKLTNLHSCRVVPLDYDAQHTGPMPRDKKLQLASLRPLIVKSGTPGSFHAYIRLGVGASNMDDIDRLTRTLGLHFGCDALKRPNQPFGLAGTTNIKNGNRVTLHPAPDYDFDRRTKYPAPRVWNNIFDVTEHLGIEMAPASDYLPMMRHAAQANIWEEPKPQVLASTPARTLAMLRRRCRDFYHNNDDRSQANWYITRLCAEYKLDAEQTYVFMTTKLDPRGYKFRGADLMADICNIRGKAA